MKEGDSSSIQQELQQAGRELSDAIVLFHSAVSERLGLIPSDWKTLSLLEQHGPLSAGDLVRHTRMAPASVTGILDRLQKSGWLKRQTDPSDRRRVLVALDPEGQAQQVAQAFGPLMTRLAEVYAGYDEGQLRLIADVFRKVAEAQRNAVREVCEGLVPPGSVEVGTPGHRGRPSTRRRDQTGQ